MNAATAARRQQLIVIDEDYDHNRADGVVADRITPLALPPPTPAS